LGSRTASELPDLKTLVVAILASVYTSRIYIPAGVSNGTSGDAGR